MACNHVCGSNRCIYLAILKENTKTEETITKTENFNFGEALQSVYPLLNIIFTYLNSIDLNNAAQVSKEWQKVALREKQKRCSVEWIYSKLVDTPQMQTSSNFYYNSVDKGILIRDRRCFSLDKYMCIHSNDGPVARMTCMKPQIGRDC